MNNCQRSSGKPLNDLASLLGVEIYNTTNLFYKGFTTDSRQVKPGWVFFALRGEAVDGRAFIAQAIEKGAIAVFAEQGEGFTVSRKQQGVMIYPIKNLNKFIGQVLHCLFAAPSSRMEVIGITGTNGKTSSCFFLAQALAFFNIKAGVAGTIGKGIYPELKTFGNTTPGVYDVHRMLNEWARKHVRWSVMEVTSHALCQGRVDGVNFKTALFTNISRDHMDYHKTMEAYIAAKARLFSWPELKYAVINKDDKYADRILDNITGSTEVITYSLSCNKSNIYLNTILHRTGSAEAEIVTPWGKGILKTSLFGLFNLYNILGVIGVLGCHGFPLKHILSAVETIESVPGRMTMHGGKAGLPMVIVDYAHTPDALCSALSSIKALYKETVTCVFGCGGDRDSGKRPLMMQAALEYADNVVLTSDNPRFEDPQQIIADVLKAVDSQLYDRVTVIEDRRQAIAQAIARAKPTDIILIAGKGHENYQEIKGVKHHLDDSEEVEKALSGIQILSSACENKLLK